MPLAARGKASSRARLNMPASQAKALPPELTAFLDYMRVEKGMATKSKES